MTIHERARYAIYFTPPRETALWQLGTRVIGYDAYEPSAAASARDPRLAAILQDKHFADPARYGFHATLRAPFELAPERGEHDVVAFARELAAGRKPVPMGDLRVARLGNFIALVCARPPPELAELAAACVRHFEPLRAPLSTADRARRLAAPLTARQLEHLDAWGYPYVFEDFTFHMTLTGNLDSRVFASALDTLQQIHAEIATPVVIDAITVLKQPLRSSPFHALERYPLADAPA